MLADRAPYGAVTPSRGDEGIVGAPVAPPARAPRPTGTVRSERAIKRREPVILFAVLSAHGRRGASIGRCFKRRRRVLAWSYRVGRLMG